MSARVSHTVVTDQQQLPSPAKKLVVTQCIFFGTDSLHWAWFIVAAYYDAEDRPIWSTELYFSQNACEEDSDSDQDSEAETASDTSLLSSQAGGPPNRIFAALALDEDGAESEASDGLLSSVDFECKSCVT